MIREIKGVELERMATDGEESLSPVYSKMSDLERSITKVRDNADILRDKMKPVLCTPNEGKERASSEVQEGECPLEKIINDLLCRVNLVNDIICECNDNLRIY